MSSPDVPEHLPAFEGEFRDDEFASGTVTVQFNDVTPAQLNAIRRALFDLNDRMGIDITVLDSGCYCSQ